MRNTILKNFAKKILKSEAFVSVIIVFVLALGIIGSSYALYMDIDTDTNYQLVEVGDLSIGFNNGSDVITLNNMTPTSDDIAIEQTDNMSSFYIYNTGTYTAKYKLKLVAVDGNQVETKYINYQICRDNADNCKDVDTLDESGETTIYTDELTPNSSVEDTSTETNPNSNPSAYYFVRLWINDQYTGSNEAKTIKMKIVIEATNASGYLDNDNTLAGKILSNSNITINNTVPNFSSIATEEEGLYKAEDDYGVSYYFRGAQSYNYVSFAELTWRVVRINGDGSIRLILDNIYSLSAFGEYYFDESNLGYMHGINITGCIVNGTNGPTSDSSYTTQAQCEVNGGKWVTTAYEATHTNVSDSTIKKVVDEFYKSKILDYGYQNYLADTIFCGDKSLPEGTEFSSDGNRYSAVRRLGSGNERPTLNCAEGATDTFSRYTVDSYETSKGVKTNGDLTYPIALLSADELVMAGAQSTNTANYLNDSNYDSVYSSTELTTREWWTMTPSYFSVDETTDSFAYVFINSFGNSPSIDNSLGVRPVINLKADVLWATGNGTSESPYTVKIN